MQNLQNTYKRKSIIGSGGNGKVWRVIRKPEGHEYALKELDGSLKNNKEKKSRFLDEIQTLIKCQGIEGVIPIVDYSNEELWYTMPLADKIYDHLSSIEEKVSCVLQISETLIHIHRAGYAHRDIKPDNILFYDGKFVLCDFGLVDIPDNPHNLTKNTSRIGPMTTIAPEMKRNAKDADGKKADVYSLAKTLWILLADNKKGFDGVYNIDDASISLSTMPHLRGTHLVELEELLMQATSNNPDDRPSMVSFRQFLLKWKETSKDSMKKSQSNWNFLLKRLFGNAIVPSECKWEQPTGIVSVLKKVNQLPIARYMFFPDGGDLDFQSVEEATEQGCIDIKAGFWIYRVKPARLIFERYKVSAWNYFLLELDKQDVAVGDYCDDFSEEVVEDTPAHYVSSLDYVYGVYDYDSGIPLPEGAQQIIRYLQGKILIVLKLGPYNFINEVTDGRHSNCTADQFRDYVASLMDLYEKEGLIAKADWNSEYEKLVRRCPYSPQYYLTNTSQTTANYEKDYLLNNYLNFDFSREIKKVEISSLSPFAEYRFCMKNVERHIDWLDLDRKQFYLCADGRIAKVNSSDDSVLKVRVEEVPKEFYESLTTKLNQYVEGKVEPIGHPYFGVEIRLLSKPPHLFTKEEIEQEMRAADDRVGNVLVISPDGYAHVIPRDNIRPLYPVVHETWCARKNYVGRYSRLSDLNSAYHYCLAKWYDYLSLGYGQPMEDYDDCSLSTEELIEKIKNYTINN